MPLPGGGEDWGVSGGGVGAGGVAPAGVLRPAGGMMAVAGFEGLGADGKLVGAEPFDV